MGHLQEVNQHNVLTLSLDLGPRQGGPREQTNPAPVLSHTAQQEARNCCKCLAVEIYFQYINKINNNKLSQ